MTNRAKLFKVIVSDFRFIVHKFQVYLRGVRVRSRPGH